MEVDDGYGIALLQQEEREGNHTESAADLDGFFLLCLVITSDNWKRLIWKQENQWEVGGARGVFIKRLLLLLSTTVFMSSYALSQRSAEFVTGGATLG